MSELPYRVIVGLEVHIELNTKTKMFCRCLNDPFTSVPNTNICPVCVALPGTLPVPNREAVLKIIKMGKALGCTNPEVSHFDRKHYFYPDLPKGYQISQFDYPFCLDGTVELLDADGSVEHTVRLERIHLEEDAGKLMHTGKKGQSKVDLNRAGVPLLEMVTKPDLTSAEQARRFMQEIRLLARTLGISDADMEKGQMRCDVNVNIAFEHNGETVKTPITEIKNVNSTRAVERSVRIESERQYQEWQENGPIRNRKGKITVGWDEDNQTVHLSRAKEGSADYRYFPEPDIPPMRLKELLEKEHTYFEFPELPNQRRKRYLGYGLSISDIEVFLQDPQRRDRLDDLIAAGLPVKAVANWLINAEASSELTNQQFKELLQLAEAGEISFAAVKSKLHELVDILASRACSNVKDAARKLSLLQEHNDDVVQSAIAEVLQENPTVVEDYRQGKEKVLGFLVGQVMKKSAGKGQPARIQAALKEALIK